MCKRVYNFSAGPSTLPVSVLEEAQRHLLALPEAGMSVLEMSHRSTWFTQIFETAEANIRKLYGVPDDHRVLFLQGGATLQFSMLALNFLRGGKADYVRTGAWANKAIKEAQKEGEVQIAWDGEPDGYARVPRQDELALDPDAVYFHYTSNETIQGIQFPAPPECGGVPLCCDMSSDFLSRPLDLSRFGLIYAGAQKNAGGSGVTVVIVQEKWLERVPQGLPSMLDYRLLAEKNSLYNTPPSFAIYVVMLVTGWLLAEGGLAQIEERNRDKARLLYDAVDASEGFYRGHAHPDSRSLMNVTWRLADEGLEKTFIEQARACDLVELKGHRSVGGIRASIYNAMPVEGIRALRDFMLEFQHKYG